jgi:hypothetical protein
VLIYALIGVSVWPRQRQKGTAGDGVGVASISEEGQRFARWSIGTIWLLGAFLQLQSPFLSPGGLAGSLMPGFAVRLVEGNGVPWTIALALLQLGIGIGILSRKRAHVFAFASIGVSLLFWWVGQSFGEFWTGTGTDPNSGPLMILLTLCAVPTAWQALRARVNRGIMPEQGLDGRSSDIG